MTPYPAPELITIELARLVESGSEWDRRFKNYDQLVTAGLSCEEAARIVCADIPADEQRRAA